MKLNTVRTQIRDVAKRWNAVYTSYDGADKVAIGKQLAALDPETATAKDVAKIIGNTMWASPDRCDECNRNKKLLVDVGWDREYDCPKASICRPCLLKAVALADSEPGSQS